MVMPPKPTVLHKLHGTKPRNDRSTEPAPVTGAPRPPYVTGTARRAWDRLAPVLERMRVLTEADAEWLAMTCTAFAEWSEADRVVRTQGMTIETTSDRGAPRTLANPAVGMRADAWRRYTAGLSALGLNPTARARVAAVPEEERDDLADFRAV